MALDLFTGVGECPECEAEVPLQQVIAHEIVQCPECGVDLELLSTNPIVLDLAPETEEDYGE